MGSYTKIPNRKTRTRLRRKRVIRKRLRGSAERPRLSVFRSLNHIYVQAIDDDSGAVLAAASDGDKQLRGELAGKKKTERAKAVGEALAAKLKSKNIETAVFDRNGFIYHGRVKAVAEGAREGGLKF